MRFRLGHVPVGGGAETREADHRGSAAGQIRGAGRAHQVLEKESIIRIDIKPCIFLYVSNILYELGGSDEGGVLQDRTGRTHQVGYNEDWL